MAHDDETFTARLPNGKRVTCRVKRDITNARRETFKKIFEKAAARDDGDGGGGGASGRHLVDQLADLLLESGRFTDRAHAFRFLTADKRGQALLARMKKAAEQTAKDPTMNTEQHLESILKDFGPIALAKHIVDSDRAPCTEGEFVAAVTKYAQAQHPNLTKAQAFEKLYSNESIWRACAVLHAAPFTKDREATGEVVLAAGATAFDEIKAKAAELRKTQPNLTEAHAFEKVYVDPANIELAKRERVESALR
jgi:hypothetical protein